MFVVKLFVSPDVSHFTPCLKKNTESDVIEIEVKVEAEFRIRRYTKNTQNLRNET